MATYIAKTFFGLEDVLYDELVALGASNVEKITRAVKFEGDQRMMYKANYCLRTAIRILRPLYSCQIQNENELYAAARAFDWSQCLEKDGTLAVDSVVNSKTFTHSKYVALKVKDAVVDQFREKFNCRPSVDTQLPDIMINVHIFENECTFSLDSSVETLNRRNYRIDTNEAPMNEVLAAGMIALTGWDGTTDFVDPMCGSGTLLIEAAYKALNIPAGHKRQYYGFKTWKDFNPVLFNEVVAEANALIKTTPECSFYGADLYVQTLSMAKHNISLAGLTEYMQLRVGDFLKLKPASVEGIMITNPPYGERMQEDDLVDFYKSIGDKLKKDYAGFKAWIISSDHEALKFVGLKTFAKHTLYNGGLECKFVGFDLYEGSKKLKTNVTETI